MEFGPRALGNRSIVADPRSAKMKDVLNARIKHRESFRPFAPSVLAERVGDWFEQDYPSPFMVLVYRARADKRELIPAVTHVDGTGRVQSVEQHVNPRYYRLIEEFERRTGVPMLLNTSFNENEPIVMTPEHAVEHVREDEDGPARARQLRRSSLTSGLDEGFAIRLCEQRTLALAREPLARVRPRRLT